MSTEDVKNNLGRRRFSAESYVMLIFGLPAVIIVIALLMAITH